MEFSCKNCLYSTNSKRDKRYLNCSRLVTIQLSKDPEWMEYILDAPEYAYLAVSNDFLCNRWEPKEV